MKDRKKICVFLCGLQLLVSIRDQWRCLLKVLFLELVVKASLKENVIDVDKLTEGYLFFYVFIILKLHPRKMMF